MSELANEAIDDRSVIICCGSGGVGKTTIAAAIGVALALLGQRVCVVTIDPARRLADALSIGALADEAQRISLDAPGELHALMLDAKATFDELVRRYANDPDQAERITSNRLYRNLGSALSGTQEYMATEKLFELYESGRFDCVVVDTPPTRAALDFLEAPSRLTSFIDNRIFRSLIGGGYARAFNVATQAVLRTIARVAGSEIVDDAVAFFQAFSGMEEGFRARAASVNALLRDPATSYALVTTPRRDAIDEATSFVEALEERHHRIDALIVNRVYPNFGPPIELSGAKEAGTRWEELVSNLDELEHLAQRQEELVSDLVARVGEERSVRIPILPTDVHDLGALTSLARQLIEHEVPFLRGQDHRRR